MKTNLLLVASLAFFGTACKESPVVVYEPCSDRVRLAYYRVDKLYCFQEQTHKERDVDGTKVPVTAWTPTRCSESELSCSK